MTRSKPNQWRTMAQGVGALLLLIAVISAVLFGLSKVLTGSVGGAVAGGIVALAVAVASKTFEHQKQRDSAIAEKKREVYRRLLAPWERLLVNIKAGKKGDEVLLSLDLEAVYASAFDAVLYGSETVVQKFVAFRSPDSTRDGIDTLRALAALLVAMREEVTGKKTALSVEAVLGTFMNFSDEERLLLRLREHVATNPEAQRQLARALNATTASNPSAGAGATTPT